MPSPSPAPSATPSAHVRLYADGWSAYSAVSGNGSGLQPVEGAAFAAGSTLSPNSPYDTFSSAPLTPGVAGTGELDLHGVYAGPRYDAALSAGIGFAVGSAQTAAYWSESLFPPIDPHLGYVALPYRIVFPAHAGADDAYAAAVAPLSASVGARDGTWQLRGGFFNLTQSDAFTFEQPPLMNVTPNIGLQTAESLGNGPLSIAAWPAPPPGLPLHGVDAVARRRFATLELTDASLPALPGDSVRMSGGSLVIDRGDGNRYSLSAVHVTAAGAPVSSTALFGANPNATPGPQGALPSSTLGGQRETIAGIRAAFRVRPKLDAVAEIGRSWYAADPALLIEPGTSKPGGFYHLALTQLLRDATLSFDAFRFEGRYADAILPYGIPENVWSAAWAWPGTWLKSNYQLVDNVQAPGSNRQGFRVRYLWNAGRVTARASVSDYRQIVPSTFSNVEREGFVDGFFLPQDDNAATLGNENQYNAWIAWQPPFAQIAIDFSDDVLHRAAAPGRTQDLVGFQSPQIVFTLSKTLGGTAVVDAGYGRFAMQGTWAAAFGNVDFFQNVVFAGAQLQETPSLGLLVQLRHEEFAGIPYASVAGSPDFGATVIVLEERLFAR